MKPPRRAKVVDLAAVTRARAELAEVATRFPELLEPAAQARTAAWIEGGAMSRKLDESAEGETKPFSARLPKATLAKIHAEAERQTALARAAGATGATVSPAQALRAIVDAYVPPASVAPKPRKDPRARFDALCAKLGRGAVNTIGRELRYSGASPGAPLTRWRNGGTLPAEKLAALDELCKANGV